MTECVRCGRGTQAPGLAGWCRVADGWICPACDKVTRDREASATNPDLHSGPMYVIRVGMVTIAVARNRRTVDPMDRVVVIGGERAAYGEGVVVRTSGEALALAAALETLATVLPAVPGDAPNG